MRFRAAHKLTSYLMVGTALGTLALSDAPSAPGMIFLAVVGVLSWFAEPDTTLARGVSHVDVALRLATVAVLCWSGYRVWASFPEPDLSPLLDFVLFLAAYKLMQRRSNRDYLQLYVLSFLLVIASAWLAQSVVFALGFAAYVVVSTWALILFHLRREIEDNYLVKHAPASPTQRVTVARVLDSRRVVGRAFFLVTALVSVGVLLGAALVFTVAPRIGFGFITGGIRRQTSVVGFSDEVRLGMHGVISDQNKTVVLRVNLAKAEEIAEDDARDGLIAGLYFRGTVYDTYDKGQWIRSRDENTRTLTTERVSQAGGRLTFVRGAEFESSPSARYADLDRGLRHEIQVASLTHPVAFALDRPIAYEIPPRPVGSFVSTKIDARWSGESSLRMVRELPTGQTFPLSDFNGARYVAYSIDSARGVPLHPPPPLGELRSSAVAPYLAVPTELSSNLRKLAAEITAKTATPVEKVRTVTRWLQRNKRYTTDLKRNPGVTDPLEDFLLEQQAGHCEYFASAAAILLRMSGVPTRYVNGFLGGEWNPIGRHITVREDRAHSWIEAYLDGKGWTRVDATPISQRANRMSRLRQVLDAMEIWWSAWVIDYNASRQIMLARGMARKMGVSRGAAGLRDWPKVSAKQIFGGLFVALVLVVIVRTVRNRRRFSAGTRRVDRALIPAVGLYQRVLDDFGRAGVPRGIAETPREFAARAGKLFPATAAPLDAITRWYEGVRFGARVLTPDDLTAMNGHAAELGRAIKAQLRATPKAPPGQRAAA